VKDITWINTNTATIDLSSRRFFSISAASLVEEWWYGGHFWAKRGLKDRGEDVLFPPVSY
jgi:hypothetical protein